VGFFVKGVNDHSTTGNRIDSLASDMEYVDSDLLIELAQELDDVSTVPELLKFLRHLNELDVGIEGSRQYVYHPAKLHNELSKLQVIFKEMAENGDGVDSCCCTEWLCLFPRTLGLRFKVNDVLHSAVGLEQGLDLSDNGHIVARKKLINKVEDK
jgi:hypothetical protein